MSSILSTLKESAASLGRRLKLKHQALNFYTLSRCSAPDLGNLQCISIAPGDTDGYRAFCVKYGLALTEKYLQRIAEGSSFWCLASETEVLCSGWLAWRQPFYIRETDFAFDMASSDTGILFNFVTVPAHRGKGLYGTLLQAMVSGAEGPAQFFIYARPENQASCKGIAKAGFLLDGTFPAKEPEKTVEYLKNLRFTNITRKY